MLSIEQVPENVWQHAWTFVDTNKDEWPEDEWYAVTRDWDINLWREELEDGTLRRRATLFRVYDGRTSTLDEDAIELAVEETLTQL